MKTYARLESNVVVELFETNVPIGTLFHPGLHWIDVTDVSGIEAGWRHDGVGFAQPAPTVLQPSPPSLSELAEEIAGLKSRFIALLASAKPATHSN